MSEKKPDLSRTLASFFPDSQEMNTEVIGQAKQYAHRQLGRVQGRPVINALDRLSKAREAAKAKK